MARVAFLALFVLATLAPPARASLLLAMDLPALAARADHVVVGEVRAVTSAWSSDHRRIYTRIDVDVVETWRTSGPRSMARVSIYQPGGAVDDIQMIVPGMPRFSVKERAVLFLRDEPERATVVGGTLGMLPVRAGAAAPEPFVWAPRLAGTALVDPRGRAGAVVPPRPTPLTTFRAQVADAFAKRGAR
jgi:hypothetical protein